MKKFAIYGRVILTEFPEWFPGFYARHGAFFDMHVTLKQTCLGDEAEILKVAEFLESFFAAHPVPGGQIDLVFDRVRAEPVGDCIMVDSRRSDILNSLQIQLLRLLNDHRRYEKPEVERYEKSFDPHITIADNMKPDEAARAITELPSQFFLKGSIKEIVLIADGALTSYTL